MKRPQPNQRGKRGDPRPCAYCGDLYEPLLKSVRQGKGQFCSGSCRSKDGHRERRANVASWFWDRVDKSGGDQSCWPWIGKLDSKGYGRMLWDGPSVGAHRMALSLETGRDVQNPDFALHSCDNPPCCNPAHLRWGDHEANMADMVKKGRGKNGHSR